MSVIERRGTERLLLTVPIRVMAFGSSSGTFTEETYAIEVNRAGARIALRHRVTSGDTLRIINLENFCEADFHVVGPTRLDKGEVGEWGVECSEPGRNIWGIDFPAPLATTGSQAAALLRCEGCGKEVLSVLTLMEVKILEASGALQRLCDQCAQLSSWTYARLALRPKEPPVPGQVNSQATGNLDRGGIERRAHKRLPLKLPVLVRTHQGREEIAKTENISKGGLAVCLGMLLAVGEIVTVICPYTEGAHNLNQKAEVRRRKIFVAGERWLYGLRYVR